MTDQPIPAHVAIRFHRPLQILHAIIQHCWLRSLRFLRARFRPCSFGMPLIGALLLSACGGERADPDHPRDLNTQIERVAELESRLDRLDERLQHHRSGRGAYRDGPTLAIDRRRRTTILDTLHQLETELQDARELLEQRLTHIRVQQGELENAQETSRGLRERITLLRRYEQSASIAQDALKQAQLDIDRLDQELRSSEQQRLEIERIFAEFAAEFLKLKAFDTNKFDDLQQRLRERLRRLLPQDEDADRGVAHVRR